jgi:hypothetical protein
MEWVETTGRTLDEAKEMALDQLGVAAEDAEFDVVEEPRSGLFGRVRQEARVRARVRPTSPRPKADRRDRKRRVPEAAAIATAESVEVEPAIPQVAASGRARGGRRAAVGVIPVAGELAADVIGEGAAVDLEELPSSQATGRRRGGGRSAAAGARCRCSSSCTRC